MRRYSGVFISVAVIVAVLLFGFGMVRSSPRLREDIGADRVASLKARLDGLTKRVEQLRNAVCDIMDEMDRLKKLIRSAQASPKISP